ncbi:hypothetical protein ES703_92183 [subsurface metagenome]
MMIPNHIGSKPKAITIGYIIGTVSTIKAKPSMKQPPIRWIRTNIPMIAKGEMGSPPAQSDKRKGILVTAMKWPKMIAPVTMTMTMQVISKLSLAASTNLCQLIVLLTRVIMRAPAAPAAPAWVGLNQPRNNPAMTRANKTNISMTPERPASFCLKLVAAPAGPRAGLRQQRKTTVRINNEARSIPGKTPAMKSWPMDCSVNMP